MHMHPRIPVTGRLKTYFQRPIGRLLAKKELWIDRPRACSYGAGWPISELARQQASPGLYERFNSEPVPS